MLQKLPTRCRDEQAAAGWVADRIAGMRDGHEHAGVDAEPHPGKRCDGHRGTGWDNQRDTGGADRPKPGAGTDADK